jgi:hypothetical protein
MNTRKVLMLLAVGVLMSGLSGVALANDSLMLANDSSEYSPSEDPSGPPVQADVSQIREPVETGALPDGSVKVESEGWLNMDVSEQNSSPELRGLPNIQAGE